MNAVPNTRVWEGTRLISNRLGRIVARVTRLRPSGAPKDKKGDDVSIISAPLLIPDGARFEARTYTNEAGSYEYKLYIPSRYYGQPLSIVVMLHGSTQSRDLKALGLYAARSLSYEGVEYELLEHRLTAEQRRIYDAYAGAFRIIHNNLDAAMRAANITASGGTLNAQAKAAARSAFESAKQRFFNHLITAMKTPTLIAAVTRDLDAGHAAVIQIVSTGEALMERRLAEIPTEDWGDVQVDITPREYVLDYLAHSFPTQLFEPFTDDDGNLASRPVVRDGQPVQCREAIERRERLIEHLAALPPVQGALDQIVQRFGTDLVAEVTGRSRRIVRKGERLVVENRAGAANLAEAQAFMDDMKRILVFSDAGGTGRSYHADLGARNRRLRVHYLLEAGWKADTAIQGLGRSNRTNQAQPPLFRPIATDVKAEKRFLSTIARRLDTLGAITKGQRQTGGQGLFRPEDNLESIYGRAALRQLYTLLYAGKIDGCSLGEFEAATGLRLTDADGTLREELPPMPGPPCRTAAPCSISTAGCSCAAPGS